MSKNAVAENTAEIDGETLMWNSTAFHDIPPQTVEVMLKELMCPIMLRATKIIAQFEGFDRRKQLLDLLIEISQPDIVHGVRVPKKESAYTRMIIYAGASSLLANDPAECVGFFKNILHCYVECRLKQELQFTAASLAFDMQVPESVRDDIAYTFAKLLLETGALSTKKVAAYWHMKDEKAVEAFFSNKCLGLKWSGASKSMIVTVMETMMKFVQAVNATSRIEGHALRYPYLEDCATAGAVLPMIINELAHKRVSSQTYMDNLRLVTSDSAQD